MQGHLSYISNVTYEYITAIKYINTLGAAILQTIFIPALFTSPGALHSHWSARAIFLVQNQTIKHSNKTCFTTEHLLSSWLHVVDLGIQVYAALSHCKFGPHTCAVVRPWTPHWMYVLQFAHTWWKVPAAWPTHDARHSNWPGEWKRYHLSLYGSHALPVYYISLFTTRRLGKMAPIWQAEDNMI